MKSQSKKLNTFYNFLKLNNAKRIFSNRQVNSIYFDNIYKDHS